jgi:pimeloyl-ACP methyl ester carboxylesterase
MAPVARELSSGWGILEPLQTATSLEGQIQELLAVIERKGDPPVTLVGWSWGAMLSFVFSATYPEYVGKLILIGSGVYEDEYAAGITETRLSRLAENETREAHSLMMTLGNPAATGKDTALARLGELFAKADSYDALTLDNEVIGIRYDVFESVWEDAEALRRSGKLLRLGKAIRCPVVAIHGDHDPHPPEGVLKPLSSTLFDFRFLLLKNCGHVPWVEREARDEFYKILRWELSRL